MLLYLSIVVVAMLVENLLNNLKRITILIDFKFLKKCF
jgi:ABC-type amino acid transport system permease subunit